MVLLTDLTLHTTTDDHQFLKPPLTLPLPLTHLLLIRSHLLRFQPLFNNNSAIDNLLLRLLLLSPSHLATKQLIMLMIDNRRPNQVVVKEIGMDSE